MSKISRIEFETGTNFGTLSAKNRLLALRAFGDLLPTIHASTVSYTRNMQTAVLQYLSKPPNTQAELDAAIAKLESDVNNLSEGHIKHIFDEIGRTCERLASYGLRPGTNLNRTRQ